MESQDENEWASLLGEALERLMAAEDGLPDLHMSRDLVFHHFIDLPTELRDQIRKEALKQRSCSKLDRLSPLSAVSREWQADVEKITFSTIRINPSNGNDAAKFRKAFVQCRRRYLACLQIIIDDRRRGPWWLGPVGISLMMEKIGQILQYISSWNLHRDKDRRIPSGIDICFVSLDSRFRDFASAGPFEPCFNTSSCWNSPPSSKMPLRAVRTEFPSSLFIAKSLTFPIDCLPLPAAMAMIETMPWLRTCSFELTFDKKSVAVIERFTDLIRRMPVLAPHLDELNIHNAHKSFVHDLEMGSIKTLSAALRNYSQSLADLTIDNFHLHQTFFEPFMNEDQIDMAMMRWTWPKLTNIILDFGTFGPYVDPSQSSSEAVDLLIAAGRAAMNMPVLECFDVATTDSSRDDYGTFFRLDREVLEIAEEHRKCCVRFSRFDDDEEQRILAAWTPFMRAEARFVRWELDTDDDDSEHEETDDADPVAVEPTRSNAARVFETSPTTEI